MVQRSATPLAPRSIRGAALCLALTLALLAPVSSTGRAAAQEATPAGANDPFEAALDWTLAQQAEDGGFVGFSGTSDAGTTAQAVLGLAAAREVGAGADVAEPLERALTYLDAQGLPYAQSGTGQAAQLALAYAAAGRPMGGETPLDPLALAAAADDPDTGLYGLGVYDTALTMLALAAADQPIPDAAFAALADRQLEDGSWAFDGSTNPGAGDSNTTAVVVQALVAADRADDLLVAPALAFLATLRTEDGAYAFAPAAELVPDANSTALVVQALIAAGPDAAPDAGAAADALLAFQNPSGAFRYQPEPPDDNLLATLQALPALAGLPFPIVTAGEDAATPAAALLAA